MSSVWYTGQSDIRVISKDRWVAMGYEYYFDSVWSSDNGWSIPASDFSAEQLVMLERLGEFAVVLDDGPRPTQYHLYSTAFATEGYVDQAIQGLALTGGLPDLIDLGGPTNTTGA